MSFGISFSSREYVDDIKDKSTTGSFDTMWDKYYMSAMVGIKARDRVITDDEPTSDPFTEYVIMKIRSMKFMMH